MKIINIAIAALVCGATLVPTSASAFDLKSVLGGDTGNMVNGLIEGVLSTSNLEVSDIAGEWTSTGSAVSFKSENLLAKAGGMAAASSIESKIDPYFKKYGLTGAVITIQPDGAFTMKIKSLTLSGTVAKSTSVQGAFTFSFKAMDKIKLGNITTYVQKSPNALDLMFDASKLKNILSAVANVSGISLAKTASSLLESYDGLCVGFKCTKTGSVEGETNSVLNSAVNALTGGKSSSNTNPTNSNDQKSDNSVGSRLLNVLKK